MSSDGLEGLEDLEAKLNNLIDPAALTSAMSDGLNMVREELATFPPQPDRMRSGHLNTWLREVGRMPAAMFVTQASGLRAHPRRAVGMSPNPPSERLLAHWEEANPTFSGGGSEFIGRIVNPVSYAAYVEGDQQVQFHAQTGWRKASQVLQELAPRILERIAEAITQRR